MNDLPYRENVCLIILNQDKKVFLGERDQSDGHWQLPQGGVETGESLAENALREAEEELGVVKDKFKILKQLSVRYTYDFSDPPEYFKNKYRGQTQTFWILEFKGDDSDIQLDKYEQEFQNWCWCNPEELLAKTAELRKQGYQKILPELLEFLTAYEQ